MTDNFANRTGLVISPVFDFNVFVHTGFRQYFLSTTAPYPENIGQRNFTPFVLRQVYTNDSYSHT
jgi:hypothetical protein